MPSIIGYANLARSSKVNRTYLSTPEYNRLRHLLEDKAEEPISKIADAVMIELDKLIKKTTFSESLELITNAIISTAPDSKWSADLSKEIYDRLLKSIDILKTPIRS